jgi:hypothetical protein
MRDIEHRRTLEAIQNSRVYDLLSAAIGPRKKVRGQLSFLTAEP